MYYCDSWNSVEMSFRSRWDPCIVNYGDEFEEFSRTYFSRKDRVVFLVAGAGFDPRSCTAVDRIIRNTHHIVALLIREIRPDPPAYESDRADENTRILERKLPVVRVDSIDIFSPDGAVVGGRNISNLLKRQELSRVTDVVVDISALSVGTMFPIVRYFVEQLKLIKSRLNIHVIVTNDPILDDKIRSIFGDQPTHIHGFMGDSSLSEAEGAARLWLPQLTSGTRGALGRLYDYVAPHDTCPILPFPASGPRVADGLLQEYMVEFEDTWSVDARSIVYADEGDPLDLYRTILKLDDLRRPVFAEAEGSMLVLSPLGSKVMALGCLLAALERDLPVAYLESVGYEIEASGVGDGAEPNFVHIWLEGDAYPEGRPSIKKVGS